MAIVISTTNATGITCDLTNGDQVSLTWFGPTVLRVRIGHGQSFAPSLTVVSEPSADFSWDTETEDDIIKLLGPAVSAQVTADGHITLSEKTAHCCLQARMISLQTITKTPIDRKGPSRFLPLVTKKPSTVSASIKTMS